MTYKVHGFLDGRKVLNQQMAHLPRSGDTIRLADELYATVTEVVWCMDEDTSAGQRVNIRMKSIQSTKPSTDTESAQGEGE